METRNTVASNSKNNSIKALTNSIHITLGEIKEIFSNAFADGKQKPQGLSFHQLAIFEKLWKDLSNEVKFQNLESLDAHFLQIEKKLERDINFYCYSYDLTREQISPTIRKMLAQVIHLYHAITKQLFHLSQLTSDDEPQKIKNRTSDLKNEVTFLSNGLAGLNNAKIENDLNVFELMLREMVEKLSQLNYGEISISFTNKVNERYLQNTKLLVALRQQLGLFKTIPQLNETTKNLQTAREEFNHNDIKKYEKEVKEHIKLLQTIKIELVYIISENYDYFKNILKQLSTEQQFISDSLLTIEGLQRDLAEVFRLILKMRGYFTKSGESCKGYADIVEALNENVKSKYLSQSRLHQSILTLTKELENFTNCYLKEYTDFKKFEGDIQNCQYLARERETVFARTDSLLLKARAVPERCCEVIADKQNILSEHVATNFDYFKNFVSHHVWKMLVGGVSGAGSGTLLALAIAGLNPAALVILVTAGAIMGTGLGGGAGIVKDFIEDKKNQNDTAHSNKQTASAVPQPTAENKDSGESGLSKWIHRLFQRAPTLSQETVQARTPTVQTVPTPQRHLP